MTDTTTARKHYVEPAGTVYPETEWTPLDPSTDNHKALLAEWTDAARKRYAEHQGRRAQGSLAIKLEAERTLRLLFLVRCEHQDAKDLRALWEESRDKVEGVRQQRDEAQRERNRLTERVAILEQSLGEALDEVEKLRQAGRANAALAKDLSTAGNGLGKRLVALTEAILAAADEHGLREEAGA